MPHKISTICFLSLFVAGVTQAATISEFDPEINDFSFFPGQSITTPEIIGSGSQWDDIVFNWYDDDSNEVANGDLFILTQEFLGAPNSLSNATPGFLASTTAALNLYTFASNVVLDELTQYWFYSNASSLVSSDDSLGGGPFAGGSGYSSGGSATPFDNSLSGNTDLGFHLQGNVVSTGSSVPEPSSLALILIGLSTGSIFARFRKSS